MERFDRKWVFAALALAVLVYALSLLAFPAWAASWRLLLVLAALVLVGVVNFLAAARAAFAKKDPAPPPVTPPPPEPPAQSIGGDVGGHMVGRDLSIEQHAQGNLAARDYYDHSTHTTIQAAAAGIQSLHQLPSPPADFTGRQADLDALLKAARTKGATIFGLRGLGGIGKTALALKVAEALKPDYPDAQLALNLLGTAKEPMSPAEAMRRVIIAFAPQAPVPEDQAELEKQYRSVLHGKRALLLLDNARDADQVLPLLPPPPCLVLITSRHRFTVPGLFTRDLDALSKGAAQKLLRTIAPRVGKHAPRLAKLCGYLPMALRNAASALHRTTRPVQEFVDQFAAARLTMSEVDASLTLSYDLLADGDKRLFAQLAVFVPAFDRVAAAAVWDLKPNEAQAALDRLVASSLLDWDKRTERFNLHDLVRDFAAARLTPAERDAALLRYAAHYRDVARAANTLYLRGGDGVLQGLALFDREWAHIQAAQAWAAARAETSDDAARLAEDYPDAGLYCLNLRLHPFERIRWLETALSAARRLGLRQSEGAHLGNLGLAYADLGDARRAIEYYEQVLVIMREIGDRRGEGATLGNLGNAYAALGDARRAIEHYEQQLVITREIGDRRGEGNALGGLGLAYAALGEPRRAIEHYEQWLTIARAIGDRRGEGQALGNLGIAYKNLGDARRAIEHYEQHLAIAREIGDRRGEANSSWNLGLLYEQQGDLVQAITVMEICVAYEREISHPDADKRAARVAELRARLAAQPPGAAGREAPSNP